MHEREQKWYSGMLGVTFNANEGRITIFRSMLEALGWPTYYRFLYNRKMGQIAVQACKAENAGAHRVTRLNETNSCEIKCVAFSRMIYELIDFVDYEDLFNKYDTLNKISFDYAVVEHEPEIEVMRFAGTWKDLGTWNTLTEAMDSHAVGEALFNEKCENVHVVNELDVPILCMGLKDVVVSASPEGILVSDKEQSSYIKPFVNMLDHRVMFAEKSWGSFKVIDIDKASMTIKVTLNAGHRMNYHSHQHRDEVWTVIAGEGKTVVDGMEQNVKAGDVITMSAGCRHTIIAETELKLIEVQLGEAIDVHDKQKFELEY